MFRKFPNRLQEFLKAIKWLQLIGIVKPFWKLQPLSDPSEFIMPKVLHHFHWMFWDHDVKWCITVTGAAELDFHFSLIQTLVGYHAFNKGISKLKQVTGHDHCAVQHYIIAAVARVASSLQEFHDHKGAIVSWGVHTNWQIPKLKLPHGVVLSICQSGAVIQWSADITQHAHVEEIKVPACAGNNQNYYNQIICHLNWLDKCFCFDLATHIQWHVNKGMDNDDDLGLDLDSDKG
ncbi:hypothetical protein EDC04DRAFT_2600795 [Pisolithus marmoratus]|nr:hypothetical protein EDC04DRAFT_2600795 [Pisolithus marmoratus]